MAYASGAPSGVILGPLAPAVAIAPVPTISSGDVQAALINTKVSIDDATQAAQDQARELTEQVIEDQSDKIVEQTDLVKERSLENFWANEELKWQALDRLETAEAQLDGARASSADAIAKSVISTPLLAIPAIPAAPVLENAPKIEAPILKTAIIQAPAIAAPVIGEPSAVQPEKSIVTQTLAQTHPFVGPVALAPFKFVDPLLIQSFILQPELRSVASSSISQTHGQGFLAPAVIKTVW